jgi:hypothetical protein
MRCLKEKTELFVDSFFINTILEQNIISKISQGY